ncbi:MAG TPA: hypothetical protein PK745_15305, partial [bacterium]|nr:hypothetical protein [bacterium]
MKKWGVIMSRLTSLLVLCLVVVSCATVSPVVPPAFAAPDNLDGFGGFADKPVSTITTVNRNADGSAHATSVSALTLTDTTQSWTPDQFIGYNLQPNVGTHMYFEIVGNTSNTITVMESDRTGGDYRGLNDYNDGDDEYRILEDWPGPHLEGDRYVLTSPQDNVWLFQGINNFYAGANNNGKGVDPHGYTLNQVLAYKYGNTDPYEMHRIPTVKGWHFNALVEYINPALYPGADPDVTSEYYMPYLPLVRPSLYWRPSYSWSYSSVVEVQPGTIIHDVFDPDFETAIWATLDSGAFPAMGATQQAYHITPYNSGWKNCAASPYCMGLKVEDEPDVNMVSTYNATTGFVDWKFNTSGARVNHGAIHSGFHPFVSRVNNGTETSQTKAFYTNFLRAEYTDGGESVFVSNIMFDGSDETTIWSDWPGVAGYVSSEKDSAALSNLNTAWGTNFETWEEVYKCDNADSTDTKTGSSNISFSNSNPDTITISGDTWDFSPVPNYIKVTGSSNNDGIYEVVSYTATSMTLSSADNLTAEANTSATLSTIGEVYGHVKNSSNANITDLTAYETASMPESSTPPQVLLDMNTMSELFWRRWAKTYSSWMDARFRNKKLTVTFKQDFDKDIHEKYARWYGFMSEDFSEKYFDAIVPMGDMQIPLNLSGETSMPIWLNSFWHHAEVDSPRGASGSVEEVRYTVLIRGVTNESGNTGKIVLDSDTSDTVVVDRGPYHAATTLALADNACTPGSARWCATVFCNMDAEPVVCSDVAFHGGREGAVWNGALLTDKLYLVDEGVTGNSINYELRSYNILYDSDADF